MKIQLIRQQTTVKDIVEKLKLIDESYKLIKDLKILNVLLTVTILIHFKQK